MPATAHLVLFTPEPPPRPAPQQAVTVNVQEDQRLLLTVVEAARRLGIGRSLMYELLDAGQIESIHVGRLRKVPVEALVEYVRRQRQSDR